jgi:hypothetical protein
MASNVDGLVAAVHKVGDVSRRGCRDEFERRFTSELMAANYERVYYDLIDKHRTLSVRSASERTETHFRDEGARSNSAPDSNTVGLSATSGS